MIGIGSHQMIDHVHGGCEQDFDALLSGGIGDDFAQEAFADTGIANEDDVFFMVDKIEGQQFQDVGFLLFTGVMEVKVKLINGRFFVKSGLPEAQRNPVLSSGFKFEFKEVVNDF